MRKLLNNLKLMSMIVTLLGAGLILTAQPVVAVGVIDDVCTQPNPTGRAPEFCADDSTDNPDNNNPILGSEGVVTKAIRIFLLIFGITALFVMLINAVRMVTSNGDSKSFESARNGIIFASVGLAIAAVAQGIVSFILTKL